MKPLFVSADAVEFVYHPAVKQLSSRALFAAQNSPATARAEVSEVKNVNLVDTASGLAKTAYAKYELAAKGIYSKYEPVAEQYVASTWHSLNQPPLFPVATKGIYSK